MSDSESALEGVLATRRSSVAGYREPGGSSGTLRTVLMLLAVCLLVPDSVRTAEDPFEECERLFESRDGWERPWSCCSCFYTAAAEHNLWTEAGRRLELHAAKHPELPWVEFYLARIRSAELQPGAEELYQSAAKTFTEQGDAIGSVRSLVNLAQLHREAGRLDPARDALDRARRQVENASSASLIVPVAIERARLDLRVGRDLAGVYRDLRRLEDRVEGLETSYSDDLHIATTAAEVTAELGRFAESNRYLRAALELAEERADPFSAVSIRYNLLNNLLAQVPTEEIREEAAREAQTTLERARDVGYDSVEGRVLRILALLEGASDQRPRLERSLELARREHDSRQEAQVLGSLAVAMVHEDPDEARRLLALVARCGGSCADLPEEEREQALVRGWFDHMTVWWETLEPTTALERSLTLLDLIEARRALQDLEQGRADFFAGWVEAYYWLAGRLLEEHSRGGDATLLESAFAVQERMRARALRDSVRADRVGRGQLPEQWGEWVRKRVRLNRMLLDPARSQAARAGLLKELDAVELSLEEAESRLPVAHTGFRGLKQVQEELTEHEALISFQLSDWRNAYGLFAGGAWIILTTDAGAEAFRLAGRSELPIELFVSLLAQRDESATTASSALHDRILRPVLDSLPGRIQELIVVPDERLHRLPFSALSDARTGRVLGHQYEISVVPSATLWHELRRRPADVDPRSESAVSEPATAPTASGQAALILASPLPIGAGRRSPAVERGWTPTSLGLLPFATREGRRIRERFGGRLLLGDNASEAALKAADLERFAVLHLAAHAVVDDQNIGRSAVVLSPGSEDEDGLLEPAEIAALNLRGKVVVLSACSGAGGGLRTGEGVMSLARSFFIAGARAVIASQWQVRDREAANFFERFYAHLADGSTLASALRATRSELVSAESPPAAWAGFVLLGDGSARPRAQPPAQQTRILGLGLLGALLLVVVGIRIWRRH